MSFPRRCFLSISAVLAWCASKTYILAVAHQEQPTGIVTQQDDAHWAFEDASLQEYAGLDTQLLEVGEEHAPARRRRRRSSRRRTQKNPSPPGSCCTKMAAEVKMLKMRVAKLEALLTRPPPRPPTKPAVKACEGKEIDDSCSYKFLPKNITIVGKCMRFQQKMLVCFSKGPYHPKPPNPPNGTKPPGGRPPADKPFLKACTDKQVGESCTYKHPLKKDMVVGKCVEWKQPLGKTVLVCKGDQPKIPTPKLPTPEPRKKPAVEACNDKAVGVRCAFKFPGKDSWVSGTCVPWKDEGMKRFLVCKPEK